MREVGLVIREDSWNQKVTNVDLYKVDTFVMGDDWRSQFDFVADETSAEGVYLERTPEISTTQIKRDLNQENLATDQKH